MAIPHLFILAVLAAKENRIVRTIDIKGAFLNADINDHEIYMELDPLVAAILMKLDASFSQFRRDDGCVIVKLNKALYGCIQSAKLWYNLLSSILIGAGFQMNSEDICVFNYVVNGEQITVGIYVDDLFVTSKSLILISALEDLLRLHFEDINVHDGLIHSFIGITFDFSSEQSVKLSMEHYITSLLHEYQVTGTTCTPATSNLFQISDTNTKLSPSDSASFRTVVAKLLYLSKRVRPDILLAISFLTTRVTCPDHDDKKKLTRVLNYLNSTPTLGLHLSCSSPLRLKVYIDASYAVHSDSKSHSAMTISLGAGHLISSSTKQKLVTKPS